MQNYNNFNINQKCNILFNANIEPKQVILLLIFTRDFVRFIFYIYHTKNLT